MQRVVCRVLAACYAVLLPAAAYKRVAAAVPGSTIQSTEFAGGNIAGYTAMQQVLNPLYDKQELIMECCGEHAGVATDVATEINTNNIYGESKKVRKELKEKFKDKCKAVGLLHSLKRAKKDCNYAYIFGNKKFSDERFQATCVPSQVCGTDTAGITGGHIALYGVVLQVLSKSYGKVAYIGKGPVQFCLQGMNMVNTGQIDQFYKSEPLMWGDMKLGDLPPSFDFPLMDKVNVVDSFGKCPPFPWIGYLYIFDNKVWNTTKGIQDVPQFIKQMDKLEKEKKAKEANKKSKEFSGRRLNQTIVV